MNAEKLRSELDAQLTKRQEIERKVVRHLIRAMKENGWIISRVSDLGEPDEDTLKPNETQAMDVVFSVDESVIYFTKKVGTGDGVTRVARIILGNDGYDCIADHSCSNHALAYDDFEEVMNAVQEYADKLSEDC